MTLQDVLSRLQGVRRNGSEMTALCPAHRDKNPSLSISESGGKILLHCHAGCTTEAVCAAAGIELRELFADNRPEQHLVAEYNYASEQGALLYQVVRYEPKSFRQRRPDDKGGWQWNLNGVRRVLYRLREVIKSKSVIVCEGEKDCETARKMGLVATCSAGGAGKWREDYSECLRGKRIAIIADADEPGRRHAQQVAESLSGKADSIRVLEFPAAKDLTEWGEHGGTREALLELIRNVPEWKPTTQPEKRGFRLTVLRDLLNEPEEKVSWLLADKLPAGGISVLSAKPKVGKSTLARCLALAVARGEPFLGCETAKGPVIYLALEEKRSEVRRHFSDLGASGEEPIHVHCAAAPKDAMAELCQVTKELKPVLVIVDPLFKFVRVVDEKAYAEVCRAIEPLLTLARDTGAHVMLVHHCGKAEKVDAMDAILGSTAIFGGVDSALILKRSDRYRTLQSSQKYGTDWPETVLEFDLDTRALSLGAEKSEADVQAVAAGIFEYLIRVKDAKTEPEIEKSVEGKTGVKRKALRTLVEQGKVGREGSGRKGDPFKYKCLFPCSPIYAETRKQESQNAAEALENIEQMLVPARSHDPLTAGESGEQERPVEEGEL
jgi:hypothetical protein